MTSMICSYKYKYIIMASKLPHKFINIKQKLTNLSIRINKVIQHKILSKSRNALIITSSSINQNMNMQHHQSNQSQKQNQQLVIQKKENSQFERKLKNVLKKTWEIYDLNMEQYANVSQMHRIQQSLKGRQYDAIIVSPTTNTTSNLTTNYHEITSQKFATQTHYYTNSLIKNILAYRLAHKYLTTSGILILSNSQADFAGVEDKTGYPKIKQPALKNILDAQIGYLGVIVGDRDYTDLNSWSVVALSQEWVGTAKEDVVVKAYADWADGRNVPMPGSFAYFKMQEQGKKAPFVQYL